MKTLATLVLALGTIGLSAQTDTASFAAAASQAEIRLEKALNELDALQEEINNNRPQLAARLDDIEAEALRLRDEASNSARIKAGFDVEVSQLENEKQSVIDNNNYIQSTLLNEYIRRFELTIDPSEKPMYDEEIREALSFLEVEEDVDDATIFNSQLAIMTLALSRVERVIGGDTFTGPAIFDGTLKDGTFALVGPVSYFTDQAGAAGITNGMIENRANIYPLPTYAEGITNVATSGSGILPVDTTDGEALEGITHTITLLEEFFLHLQLNAAFAGIILFLLFLVAFCTGSSL